MRSLSMLVCLMAIIVAPSLAETAGEAVDDWISNLKNMDIFKIRLVIYKLYKLKCRYIYMRFAQDIYLL